MENTTPGPLKNNLTSTPCMKRKSLFTAPDVSPIKTGTSTKRNSATTIVSKIPVKLTSRKLLTKIPRLSGQTKTSETEKPVLRTIDNNDQADATGTNKGKKGNKCPKVSAPNKEASSSKNVSSSTINKKNDNLSNMDWEEMEVLSHEVLDPVSKKGSNLDVDLDGDDDDGDFELSKKGKRCLSPKKAKQADSKGADKKPAKSARGKKKADAEDTEVLLENIPEETKINSKMQLDGEAANKIAETRKALKKAPNKDPKKPLTRNKKKTADSDLEPVIEESNDADDEKKAVTRNKRKSVGGNLGTLAEEPMIIDVEDEPKSPVRNKKRTFDLGTVAEEQENVRDQKDSSPKTKNDLGPVADKKKNAEDQHETPTRKKSKSAYSDEKAKEPVQVEGPKKRTTRNMKKNADSNASASEPIAEIEPIDVEIEEQPAQTRKIARAKKMRADKKEKNCLSEPSVEVPEKDENEEVLNSDEKAIEVDESEPAPKRRRNKKNQDDIKEVSVAFSEMGEKENEESKEPQPKSKTDTTVKTNSRKQKSTALSEIPSNAQPSTSAEPAETTVNKLRKQKVAAMDGIPSNPQPSTSSEASGSCPVKKKDVKFDSFNATGGKRQIPLNRIFGSPFVTDSEVSPTPVKVFRSIKPSENVMGGFISILAGSSHNGFSTNYNMYFLMSDTQLKVNIMGVEKNIENQLTSFVVPKDCRFSIENVGSGTAVLSFTKLRSI